MEQASVQTLGGVGLASISLCSVRNAAMVGAVAARDWGCLGSNAAVLAAASKNLLPGMNTAYSSGDMLTTLAMILAASAGCSRMNFSVSNQALIMPTKSLRLVLMDFS